MRPLRVRDMQNACVLRATPPARRGEAGPPSRSDDDQQRRGHIAAVEHPTVKVEGGVLTFAVVTEDPAVKILYLFVPVGKGRDGAEGPMWA